MAETPVSRTYAQAIVELGDEHGTLDQIREDFESFHEVWKGDNGVRRFLSSPAVSRERKVELVAKAGEKFGEHFRRFLGVLAEKGRILFFGDIYESFRNLLESRGGLIRARATFAVSMEEARVQEIESTLAEKLGKKVSLWVGEDPEILGGMILQIGDRRVDMSLRRSLEEFRQAVAVS